MKKIRFHDWIEKKKRQASAETALNPYFESISASLGIFQVILYFALFAFILLSFISNTNLITYRNFYYFFKDLDASAESIDVFQSDSVTYPTSDSQYFTLYRGGLAVAGNNSVTAFTASGRQTISQNLQYRNPMTQGKGRYLLVYEMGGRQYSLYNSYTQLYADQTEFPITGAAVSDEGIYAILSSSEEYTSVVSLYNDNFTLINRYNKNSFITDVALDKKGRHVALLVSEPVAGAFQTTLELYITGNSTYENRIVLGEGMALSCQFTDSGNIAVLFDDSVAFVAPDGETLSTYAFAGEIPSVTDIGGDGIVLALRDSMISTKNHIIVFDKNGKMVYNETIDIQVREIARYKDTVFLMHAKGIQRLSWKDGTFLSLEYHIDKHHILAVSSNEILICSPQKAEFVRIQSQ